MAIGKRKYMLLLVACFLFGLVLRNKKRITNIMVEIAEHVKQKIDDAEVIKMIDAAIGEILYLSIVSAGQMTDLLLDIRQAIVTASNSTKEH